MDTEIVSKPTILIVEDEPDLADMYFTWLKDDYDVEVYLDGRDAIERLRPDIDVILLDRRIPDIPGEEILTEIRNMQLPAYVVMVTAIEPDDEILELEFDDYLTKPVERDDIVGAVERMLERQRHDDQLRELFQVISKLATLEAKLDQHHREQSTAYQELEDRFESLWEDIETASLDIDYQSGTLERLEDALANLEAMK